MKIAEAVFRIFDRQDWLRVNRARARVKVLVDKIGTEEICELVEEELKGDWVDERDFTDAAALPPRRGGGRTRQARETSSAERRPHRVRPLRARQRRAAEAGRLLGRHGQDHARRPHARAVPRPRPDHARLHGRLRAHDRAAEPDAALGPQRGALRRLAAARRARPRRRGRGRDHRRRELPRHRQLQARHHELDGAQRGGQRAHQRDGDRRPAGQAHPREDERLPERLQPAPHREHRVLRRVDQGRRAHDPGLRRAHRRPATRAARSPTARA